MARIRSFRRGLALAALVLSLALTVGGCARRPVPPSAPGPSAPPPTTESPALPAAEPAPPPADTTPPAVPSATGSRYPPYRYHVEGPDVRLVAADFISLGHHPFPAEYWLIGGDPVTIEIRFDGAVPDPAAVVRQIRQCLPGALVHEEGHQAGRVFVRATVPPGQYAIGLTDGEGAHCLEDHRILILDRGGPARLMRWEPGGSPETLGEYLLPVPICPAALEVERGEAFFGTGAIDWEVALGVSLWRWQSGAQPSLTLLGGLWPVRSPGFQPWVYPRGEDLLVQTLSSLFVLDRTGEPIATLVEKRSLVGTALGPGGEVAVLLGRGDHWKECELDLTVFTAALETHQNWEAICPHGVLESTPDVQPLWYQDEIFFLALQDHPRVPPAYQLVAFDLQAGSLRRVLGPVTRGVRVGRSHYALVPEGGDWMLWDLTTASFRPLPSARELGELWVTPVAAGLDWVVFRSDSGLIAWSSTGVTALGRGVALGRMGEAFVWWAAVSEDR